MNSIHYVFWTGGWDSTFRVLDLTINHKKIVQPVYIIENKHKKSASIEQIAMENIRKAMFTKFPFTEMLLLPTHYLDLEEIEINLEVIEAYETLTKKCSLGGQYVYLASHSLAIFPDFIELGIIKHGRTYELLHPEIIPIEKNGLKNFMVRQDLNSPICGLFGRFHFPLINQTKMDVKALAEEKGISDILEMSWFCHNPRPGMVPCGICPPCCYAIEDGFGYRIPLTSRLRYYFSLKRRIYNSLRNHPVLFRFLRRMKQNLTGKQNVIR